MSPMSPKTKKILNIVVDVVVAVVLAFALFLAICTISSKAKGYDQYTEIFGKAYLAVRTESMEKNCETGEVGEDNFSKGDLITIKLLTEEEVQNLEVGTVITFKIAEANPENGYNYLNSHRIFSINKSADGKVVSFVTKGDNNTGVDNDPVSVNRVVGVYQGKASGIGHMFLFMSSSAGFFTCVVLPTLLIVVYFAVNLVLVIRKEKKAQTAQAQQEQLDERERIRQELLAEMQAGAQPSAEVTPSVQTEKSDHEPKTEEEPQASSFEEENK